jgi:hypothetical protein
MNQKFWISAAVMFVMSFGLGFMIHGGLLSGDYARFPNLMRPMAEAQGKLPFMLLAHISLALAFTWIYLKGREDKPWLAQGARYGIAVAGAAGDDPDLSHLSRRHAVPVRPRPQADDSRHHPGRADGHRAGVAQSVATIALALTPRRRQASTQARWRRPGLPSLRGA